MAIVKTPKPSKTPTTKSKDKDKNELSPLEKKILSYVKRDQPVFLHGNDTTATGRKNLILKVHKANGGIDARWEYIGSGVKLKDMREMYSELKKAIDDNNHSRTHEILENCKDTRKTWAYLDCRGMDSEDVYKQLFYSRGFSHNRIEMVEYLRKTLANYGLLGCLDLYPTSEGTLSSGVACTFRERKVFYLDGLLFVDNLSCNPEDIKERRFFENVAGRLEDRRDTNRDSNIHNSWLIVYAYDYRTFPRQFSDQFKLVSLNSKTQKSKKEEIDNFDDVKLEMTVDHRGTPLFDAVVSANEVVRKKLPLQDRFIAPLYLLAYTVKEGKNNGWVYNKDLQEKCKGETVAKIKLAIKKAFGNIIGERAEGIIDIKYGSAKKLMLLKKNITLKQTK